MTGPSDDDLLLSELGELLVGHAGPPREVVDAAVELFTWRSVDAELAALAFDSLLDNGPALARAAAQPRIITFEAAGLTIEAEVDAGPAGRRLLGQLVPAQPAELELRTQGDPILGQADDHGRFVIALPACRQRVSLRCRLGDDTVVDAAWLSL